MHGTYENAYNSFAYLSPALKKQGHCVFTPNYGRTTVEDQGGVAVALPAGQGVASINQSSKQLADYIDRVRAATGAAKVDVIAHSQGGLLVRHYLKFNGGGHRTDPSKNTVQRFVMLSAPNHGTTLLGYGALHRSLVDAGVNTLPLHAWLAGAAGTDQTVGSSVVKSVNRGRLTFPGIEYTAVASRYDQVVTPHTTTFLPARGVRNIELQHGCAGDTSDHLTITYSARAISIAQRALDSALPNSERTRLTCQDNPWLFSF